jgi:hypothetical protein
LFSSLFCCFVQPPIAPSLWGQNFYLNVCSTLHAKDHTSHPYKIRNCIINLHTLIFIFIAHYTLVSGVSFYYQNVMQRGR